LLVLLVELVELVLLVEWVVDITLLRVWVRV
jgi:hypothetical protein